jgi:hypothetical protein
MALDTTRVRRRLPQPPTDGSPGMDAPETPALDRRAAPARQAAPRRSRTPPNDDAAPITDGRSLRATGRVVQLNIKTSPETKARFLALAQERQVLLVDLFEQALDALEAEDGLKGADEDEE